jgi:hypothetical protein
MVRPALAQNEPVRFINRAPMPATQLFVVRSGQAGWSANLLREPLAPGRFLSVRLGEGAGCRFDVRMVLQDGREILRQDADVCATRSVDVALAAAPVGQPGAAAGATGAPAGAAPPAADAAPAQAGPPAAVALPAAPMPPAAAGLSGPGAMPGAAAPPAGAEAPAPPAGTPPAASAVPPGRP